ncbi:MAG: radical SAM protein [Nitrospirae bacterium]|nr:radical SAM protein [Nitrospirota bacterium]
MPIKHNFDFFIQWHLTERCNLRCRHCYQSKRGNDEMALPEIKEALCEIAETINIWKELYGIDFSSSFNITGGEPLLRDDIFEILKEVSKPGFEVFLLTNGILADKDTAFRLREAGVKGVQVSIEGTDEIHDSVRGKGSFSASAKGIGNLLNAGLEVTVNATLSELNARHFMEIFRLAACLGVHKLGFSRLVPSGRGRDIAEKMLSAESAAELYKKIFSIESGSLEIVTGDPVASQSRKKFEASQIGDIPSGGCAAGISGITILPDGTLLPCRRLDVPIGNIRRDSLREVWAGSEVLQALRDKKLYKGRCGNCERWSDCRGCRAIAFAYSGLSGTGDFLAEDPQCFIF